MPFNKILASLKVPKRARDDSPERFSKFKYLDKAYKAKLIMTLIFGAHISCPCPVSLIYTPLHPHTNTRTPGGTLLAFRKHAHSLRSIGNPFPGRAMDTCSLPPRSKNSFNIMSGFFFFFSYLKKLLWDRKFTSSEQCHLIFPCLQYPQTYLLFFRHSKSKRQAEEWKWQGCARIGKCNQPTKPRKQNGKLCQIKNKRKLCTEKTTKVSNSKSFLPGKFSLKSVLRRYYI